MKRNLFIVSVAMLLQALAPRGLAQDIDLFVGAPAASSDAPNVLIILDNTANWNQPFSNEIAALASTINGLPADKFRVGLMLFTETGSGDSNADGGYVRAAIRPFTAANKTLYAALVNSLGKLADKSNGGKLGKTMVEAYRYYSGAAPYAGNNKVKTDYNGNTSGTAASNAIYALPGNALSSKSGSPYVSPIVEGSCGGNYIIYISNGAVQDNTSDSNAAMTELGTAATAEGLTGMTAPIPISPSGSQDNAGDEWARFLKQSSLGVTTYTVDVDKITNGQGPGWTALLKSMARVSGGKYFDVGSGGGGAQISAALGQIFSEIQSVDSVFSSVSLPVSVNTQGTYSNQVFVGMFRPDADAFPRWLGNLKQYKLGEVNGVLRLVDADSQAAINSQTGFVTACARSFWTPSTTDNYWYFQPAGDCLAVAGSNASNYPDGNVVEKGAQAYKLRSSTSRTVHTCSTTFASCTGLITFNSSNVSQTDLGAASTSERDALINWARGLDVDDENGNGITTGEMRPSAHGDVVHSRPVALNYGTEASPQVVVYYSDNQGVLHAINGNRSASNGTVAAGAEYWAFIPPEFIPSIKRIRDNNVQINYFGNTTTTPTPQPKPFAMDGPLSSFRGEIAGTEKTFLYAGMRRGGRVLYAFDVTTPGSPVLKWKRGCPNAANDTGCSTSMTGVGQTWSTAKVIRAAGHGSGESPLLIMGGGYDACEDADPHTCSTTKGNRIFIIDGNTGSVLQTMTTDRAVVGDVFAVNGADGLIKFAYAADLGGNVYRISGADAHSAIGATAPANTGGWTLTKIASLGCATPAACSDNRKFMFGPDVVEPENGTYNLMIGSGDREKPLIGFSHAAGVGNYFFMIRDRPADASWLTAEAGNCGGQNVMCLASLQPVLTADTPAAGDLAAKKGWYLGLSSTEQVVTSAITVYGVITFSTHMPATYNPGQCSSNLGTTRVYNINYADASTAVTGFNPGGTGPRYQQVAGGGLPPSPVAGVVTLDDGKDVVFVIGSSPDSPLEGSAAPTAAAFAQPKSRIYWYIEK